MFYIILISPLLVATLVVWLAAMIAAWDYGTVGRAAAKLRPATANEPSARATTPLTIVVAAHNQAQALRRNIPSIIQQDYDHFEVIVVDVASDDDTRHVLETLELEHTNLRHTYTPASARDISLERLALTLGIRAARGEWVVVTQADCRPASPQWLATIAAETTEARTAVIGLARFVADAPRQTRLERLWQTLTSLSHVLRANHPVGVDTCNVALRKAAFLEAGGFGTDVDLNDGAVEILLNRIARPHQTGVVLAPAALVEQEAPLSTKLWQRRQLGALEMRSHMRHTLGYRTRLLCRMTMPWLVMAIVGITLALSVLAAILAHDGAPLPSVLIDYGRVPHGMVPEDTQSIFVQATVVAVVLTLLLATYVATKLHAFYSSARALGYGFIWPGFLLHELNLPFSALRRWLTWKRVPHNEFRKKFV